MLNPGIDHFIDTTNKKASFDSAEFKDLLTLAKSMVDSKVVAAEKLDSLNLFSARDIFRFEDLLIAPQAEFDGKGALYRAPSVIPNQGYSYRSELALSINDKTKNKQEAWEFVKFVLSNEVQADHAMSGMPVNKSAFHQIQSMLKDPDIFKNAKVSINEKEIKLKAPTPEEVDRLETFITGINSVQETDNKITSLVFTELAPFFSGQKSAEDVAKAIQSKVNTYLNE
jgi:multiple sugar transport system substrate-binding protein